MKVPAYTGVLLVLAVATGGASCDSQEVANSSREGDVAVCAHPLDADALLNLTTGLGEITIDLHEDAAPLSVKAVKNLACFGSANPGEDAVMLDNGYYSGFVFDHTQPNIEIRLSRDESADGVQIPKEINALSLGLDKQVIESPGQAMDMYQFVVHKEFAKNKRSGAHSAQLREWIEEFRKDNNPAFLIGKSRKDINEALGYPYITTVESYPIKRGSVLLQPSSKTHSSARLVIALAKLTELEGKWTVIGTVTHGIEIAERIAKLPNTGRVHPRWQPLEPVAITNAELRLKDADKE